MGKKKALKAVERADREIAGELATVREHPAMKLAGAASDIADQPQLATLCLSVVGAGLATGRPRLARAGVEMFAAFGLATWLKSRVKHAVDRTRPRFAERAGYRRGKGKHDEADWNSFPSGHTAGAVAVAQALGRSYPAARLPALAAAATVAAIQVPRGKHYVTDLIGGAAIGWSADLAIASLVRRLSRNR